MRSTDETSVRAPGCRSKRKKTTTELNTSRYETKRQVENGGTERNQNWDKEEQGRVA